jgi:DNA-binding transcriptional regulator PaaX
MVEDKATLTRLILEKFQEAGELTLEAILPSNRAEGKMWRQILGLSTEYEFSPRTFSAILSRLKKQGLVSKTGSHRKSIWAITSEGKDFTKDAIESSLPKEDGVARLVMFDIPETESGKRKLVRVHLISYGFKQLQKSVWVGYRPLPEKFIKSLDDMKLKDKVQIVSINKSGTLEMI